jgi:hypothetical protein
MKPHTLVARPSLWVVLVALLFLALDLVVIGWLSFGPTRILLGLGLIVAWLLLVILSCSRRIRVESVSFLKRFLDAARDING